MANYLFYDDYSEGAHPAILEALREHNVGQEIGYGEDQYSRLAAERIRAELDTDADVHFVSGGTQANVVCLAAMLRPHEGVIAASCGHIHVHETGAIEATGHKIITVNADDGKLTPALIDGAAATHQDEHTVKPRAVFVSQATELGTVYSRDELQALATHAHERGLRVFLDGARLAMACAAADMSLADIAASGVDIMYIGGTKNGGLFGEAIAILNSELREEFRYTLKQRGALLAKGRALGIQFARFFDDDHLWYALGAVANENAALLERALDDAGVRMYVPRAVNQVFPVLREGVVQRLAEDYGFHRWATPSDGVVIRLVCSWAAEKDAIFQFGQKTALYMKDR